MNWLALDIGGANLKAADGRGYAVSQRFALWRRADDLAAALRHLIANGPPADHLAVTMTGELADCYESQEAGVRSILNALNEAADGRHTRVFLSDGRLVAPPVAARTPQLAAASNWLALAQFAGRFAAEGAALLIDVGSTTCDVAPLVDGQSAATGANDTERLLAGELVYTGVERSPLCAMVQSVPYRGAACSVAQELFATMLDAYLILGDLPEAPQDCDTADSRPAVKAAARTRLGRMICAGPEQFNHRDAVVLAQSVVDAQQSLLADAVASVVQQMPAPPRTVLLSGQGEFLAKRVVDRLQWGPAVVSLTRKLSRAVSCCAPAHALAVLARETAEQ